MYRILTIAFLFISMSLAWWALELQAKLVVKEKALFDLRKERDTAQSAEKQANSAVAPLRENVARLQKERDAARQVAAQSPTQVSKLEAEDPNAGLLGGLLKQMDSPEMKTMMRSQQLAANRKEYGPLLKRWNLPPADADIVLNFLTDKEDAFSSTSGDAAANVNFKSILGDARMKELEAFEQAQSRTRAVGRYAEHLDISGFPLNAEQSNQLADIIQTAEGTPTEQGQIETEEMRLLSSGAIDEATLAKIRKRDEDKQSRIIQKAKLFLSPDQVSGLQSAFREENQERDASMKMVGEIMKAGGAASGTVLPWNSRMQIQTKVTIPLKK